MPPVNRSTFFLFPRLPKTFLCIVLDLKDSKCFLIHCTKTSSLPITTYAIKRIVANEQGLELFNLFRNSMSRTSLPECSLLAKCPLFTITQHTRAHVHSASIKKNQVQLIKKEVMLSLG